MGSRGSRPTRTPDGQVDVPEPHRPVLPETDETERDTGYTVGKRYKVARTLDLWSGENLDGTRYGVLTPYEDVVLLVAMSGAESSSAATGVAKKMKGLVIPQPAEGQHAGWVSLEDIQLGDETQPALSKVEVSGSWNLKARYNVQHPVTLRAGPSLYSTWLGDLLAGDEVLLLDFGVTSGAGSSSKAKLRALVVAGDKLGWISPESGTGEHLLAEVNLLSRKVVDIHQQALQQNAASLRKSYHPGRTSPWKEGATYRMLEAVEMRSGPDVHSSVVGEVSAGSLVELEELKHVIIEWGWCPVASILVHDGPEKGLSGWVHCTAKDGHDVVDTRDHTEYENALKRMKESAEAFAELASDARPHDIQAISGKADKASLKEPREKLDEITAASPREDAMQKPESPTDGRSQRMAAEFSELSETLRKLEELEQRELRWIVLGNASKAVPQLPVLRIEAPGPDTKAEPRQCDEWPLWCSCNVKQSDQRLEAAQS